MTTQSLHDLERDIERSRARLDMTISQLQGKMTVSGVVDDVLGTARNGRYAPLFESTLDTIRRNPVPVMLIVMGIGLLAYRLGQTPSLHRQTDRDLIDDAALDDDWADEVEDMRLYQARTSSAPASADRSDAA